MAAGKADPVKAWPEYFGKPAADEDAFPSVGADMTAFRWETPDQERITAELEQLMHGAHVTMRDGQPVPSGQPPPAMPPAALRPMHSAMAPVNRTPPTAEELEWG